MGYVLVEEQGDWAGEAGYGCVEDFEGEAFYCAVQGVDFVAFD